MYDGMLNEPGGAAFRASAKLSRKANE